MKKRLVSWEEVLEMFREQIARERKQDDLLTPTEVAGKLRKCTRFVYAQIRSGRLRAYRIGQRYQVSHADLEQYKKGQRVRVRPIEHRPKKIDTNELVAKAKRDVLVEHPGLRISGEVARAFRETVPTWAARNLEEER